MPERGEYCIKGNAECTEVMRPGSQRGRRTESVGVLSMTERRNDRL